MKRTTVIISMILVLAILTVSVTPVLAESVTALDEGDSASPDSKISEALEEKLEVVDEDEEIPVWIWFTDINKRIAYERIEQLTGYSQREYENLPNLYYDKKLIKECFGNNGLVIEGMNRYIERSKEKNEEFNRIVDTYNQVKSNVLVDMYTWHNDNIINSLSVSKESIVFRSSLTPSAIINLNKKKILDFDKNCSIKEMLLCEDNAVPEPYVLFEKQSMHYNQAVTDNPLFETSLTGEGINVLAIDQNHVRPDQIYYNSINNISSVKNVINATVYSTNNTSVLPHTVGNSPYHGNLCVSRLKQYASDVNVYCVTYHSYSDIEWTLNNCSIDLINGSVNYGCNDYYDAYSKWFDALVYEKSIPLIASAGNDYNWWSVGWPNVISPAKGYNSIAVGAYTSSQNGAQNDKRKPYRYSTTDSSLIANYKPDVMIAAGSTSEAAPALTGILSCMLQITPELRKKPEETKAIVMASCHRKVLPNEDDNDVLETMAEGLTRKQGAGAVDAYRIIKSAVFHTYGSYVFDYEEQYAEFSLLGPNDLCTLDYNDGLNISIAWLLNGHRNSYDPTNPSNYIGQTKNLFLDVLIDDEVVETSLSRNSNKQMAYIPNGNANQVYSIRVKNISEDEIKVGYAWSEQGISQIIDTNLQGNAAIGHSIQMNVTLDSNENPYENDLVFMWQKSSNGITWNNTNVHGSTYQLSENDFLKYIRCVLSTTNHALSVPTTQIVQTDTKVFIFGDANLDGVVDNSDTQYISRYLAGLETMDDTKRKASDVNLNGYVDSIDVYYIMCFLENMCPSLPIYE